MRTILVIDPVMDHRDYLNEVFAGEYDPIYCDDTEEALQVLKQNLEKIKMILLNGEVDQVKGWRFVKYSKASGLADVMPVVLICEDENNLYVKEGLDAGALDFCRIYMKKYLFKHRLDSIRNFIEINEATRFAVNPESSTPNFYLFNNVIGPAIMLEMTGDHYEAILLNDKFYELLTWEKEEYNKYLKNLEDTLYPSDREPVRAAMKEAVEKGSSLCIVHGEKNQVIQNTYRLISKMGEKALIICTIRDVTDEKALDDEVNVLTSLPDTIIYDYIVDTDTITIGISGENGNTNYVTENFLAEFGNLRWISPESEKSFKDSIKMALERPTTDFLDLRARFGGNGYFWYRTFFRSISGNSEKVYRVIGRIDDIERNKFAGIRPEDHGIYDAATQLLTYQAIKSYIEMQLKDSASGTLIIFKIVGLKDIWNKMGNIDGDYMLKDMTYEMKQLFFQTDIFGRFGAEGFIVFMPDAASENMLKKRLADLVEVIKRHLKATNTGIHVVVKVGTAMTKDGNTSLNVIMNEANRELELDKGLEQFLSGEE